MAEDLLVEWPVDKWADLQTAFMADWPRSIAGYTALETQRELLDRGIEYGFKVYCPFGNVRDGMVAINRKLTSYEVIILCPVDDTEKLALALKTTKLISWTTRITIPFAPKHIIECIEGILPTLNMEMDLHPAKSFYLDKNTPLFEDVSFPQEITFDLLTEDHIDLLNSTWPHKYSGSRWYFELMIKMRTGFGLFQEGKLISWMLINESGILAHVYTLEEYRRKGYAELLLKLVCNIRLKECKLVVITCVYNNLRAINLYSKVGFICYDYNTKWCYLRNKEV